MKRETLGHWFWVLGLGVLEGSGWMNLGTVARPSTLLRHNGAISDNQYTGTLNPETNFQAMLWAL